MQGRLQACKPLLIMQIYYTKQSFKFEYDVLI